MKISLFRRLLPWLFLALAAYVPVFHHLGVEPVKTFDESLFALRAYRLATTGQYLNNYNEFDGGPSATNVKTPLFTGVQALSFRVMGYTELALRLPVALTVLGLMWLMVWAGKYAADWDYGWISAMVLLAVDGFFHVHAARSGDHDVPLSLCLMISAWALYRYFEASPAERRRWIWLAAMGTWAAMMTKGIAGALWLPGLAVYVTYRKGWPMLLRDKHTWLALASVIVLVMGYYAYREWDTPGFLFQVWKGELHGHYLRLHDGHDESTDWYVRELIHHRFAAWVWWIPASWAFLLLPNQLPGPLRRWVLLMNLVALSQLVVISFSTTKLGWYDVPMFAPMSMMVAAVIWMLWRSILEWLPLHTWQRWLLVGTLLIAIWLPAYLPVWKKNLVPRYLDYPGERYGGLMRQSARVFPNIRSYTLMYRQFSTHCLFYRLVYNEQMGYDVKRATHLDQLQVGEVVMVCEPEVWAELQERFLVEPLTFKDGCYLAHLAAQEAPSEVPRE